MFLIIPILLILTGCGRPISSPIGTFTDGVVVGKINWIEVDKNLKPEIIAKTKTVADLYIPSNQTRCNGFLISEDTIITNYHCVSDSILSVGVTANFSHELGSSIKNEFSCEKFIYSNEELDFALLGCKGSPGKKLGYLLLDSSVPGITSPVYMIHHNCDYFENPGCDYTKKLSGGKVIRLDKDLIYNTTDSLLGSSGAPLLSAETGKVVGIHHAGKVTRDHQRGPYNLAIPSGKIIQDLRENEPEILERLYLSNVNAASI
jgi:Trypsin-like peptidase domain